MIHRNDTDCNRCITAYTLYVYYFYLITTCTIYMYLFDEYANMSTMVLSIFDLFTLQGFNYPTFLK